MIAGAKVQGANLAGCTAAHLAARRGHAAILDKILLAGYAVDTPTAAPGAGSTVLHIAARHGHTRVWNQQLPCV